MIHQERSRWRWLKAFFFPSVSSTWSCACRRSWKLKRSKSTPAETPLFHRKHCSCNISSVVQPVIQSLCDITQHHCVTHFHNLCLTGNLERKSRFREAAQLLLGVLVQECVSWPIRADWVFGKALKRQELRQRGNTVLQHWMEQMCYLNTNTCKPILIVTQNKIYTLKEHNMSPLI